MRPKREITVLLVEDDLNDIFLVKRAFKKTNLTNPLQIVTDGVEAVQYLIGEENTSIARHIRFRVNRDGP